MKGRVEVACHGVFLDTLSANAVGALADDRCAFAVGEEPDEYAVLDQRRLTDLGTIGRPEEGGSTLGSVIPSDWVRDYIQVQKNHFPELEEAAEELVGTLSAEPLDFAGAARDRLYHRRHRD